MSYADEVAADGPTGWLRLSETSGSTVADQGSAGGGDWTVVGADLDRDGPPGTGSAVWFDGVDDVIRSPSGGAPFAGWRPSTAITFEALIRRDSEHEGYAAKLSIGPFQTLRVRASGQIGFTLTTDAGVSEVLVWPATHGVAVGEWCHVVGQWSAATEQTLVFINGTQVGSGARTGSNLTYTTTVSRRPMVSSDHAGNWFHGKVDEVAVYDYLLSPARIQAHHAAAFAEPAPAVSGDGSWTEQGDGIAGAGTHTEPATGFLYDVRWRPTTDTEWTYVEDIGPQPWRLEDLDPGTEYEAQFRTHDPATGLSSAWSDSVVATTAGAAPVAGAATWGESDDGVVAEGTTTRPEVISSAGWSEDDDGIAAAGGTERPTFAGQVDIGEDDDGIAAAGTAAPPELPGTASWSEQPDGIAAAGATTRPVSEGSGAWHESDDGIAAEGAAVPPTTAATASWSEQPDGIAGAGMAAPPDRSGTLGWLEADDGIAADGVSVRPEGVSTVTWSEAPDGIAAAGTRTVPTFDGAATWTEADDGILAAGASLFPAPTGLTVTAVGDGVLRVAWDSTFPDGFVIERERWLGVGSPT